MKLLRIFDYAQGSTHHKPTKVTHHEDYTVGETTGGLSVLFTILCIVDLFGVFPVITLPKSVIFCGVYGLPLVLSVFGLQLYTAVLLGRSWILAQEIAPRIKEKNRFPYAAVAELAFGTPAKRLVTFLIDAAIFGSGVPNFIIEDSDSLVLEDEFQRIKLVGECIDVHQVVTGVVCAILGSEDEDGIFTMKDVCWAGCGIQKSLPTLSGDRFIVLMSGLNASKTADHMLSMNLLMEWISGLSGTSQYQEEVSKIVRVIVAGGVFANPSNDTGADESQFMASVELLDSFAAAVSAVAPLDLMPSSGDPTGIMLPQKPFHYCLFPKAIENKSFHRVTNPYECNIGGFTCLGTSGEPVKDIMRYSKLDNSLEVMKRTLLWRHMAPTCPDTIPCYPCTNTDPFIIYNCPAVYFCGNSDKFATDIYEASQTLQIFWWKITGGSVGITYCVWMVILALLLCPVMWLGSPKDMKPIAVSSVLIVTTVAITTWTCILRDVTSPDPMSSVLDQQPQLQDFLIAYGILAFQFDIHPMLLTLQVDMKDSRKINAAVLGGFGVTGLMFAVTTVLAALRYGTNVDSNILQSIPSSIPLYLIALLVTLQLCLSSAVSHSALFQHIEDLLKIPRDFCFQRCLIRSSIVALAVFLAESVPRFDLVMGLVGSTLTGPLMFICPPIFFLKLCYMKSKKVTSNNNSSYYKMSEKNNGENGVLQNGDQSKSPLLTDGFRTRYETFTEYAIEVKEEEGYSVKWYDVVLASAVMSIGLVATVVATYSSWSNSITYATFSPPCLMNSTAAARSFLQSRMNI